MRGRRRSHLFISFLSFPLNQEGKRTEKKRVSGRLLRNRGRHQTLGPHTRSREPRIADVAGQKSHRDELLFRMERDGRDRCTWVQISEMLPICCRYFGILALGEIKMKVEIL